MSSNLNTIQILKQQAEEAQKGIRVLEAVKGVNNYLVVAVDSSNITVTPSEGLDITTAIGALGAAIRSFSANLHTSESLSQLLTVVENELNPVYDRAEQLKVDEELADKEEAIAIEGEYVEAEAPPMDAPAQTKKATRTRPRK